MGGLAGIVLTFLWAPPVLPGLLLLVTVAVGAAIGFHHRPGAVAPDVAASIVVGVIALPVLALVILVYVVMVDLLPL